MNVSKIENEPICLRRMPVAKLRAGNIQSLTTGKDLPPKLTILSDRIECQILSNLQQSASHVKFMDPRAAAHRQTKRERKTKVQCCQREAEPCPSPPLRFDT